MKMSGSAPGSHCSTQNSGFSESGYVIKPPQPSSAIYGAPPFTAYLNYYATYIVTVGPKLREPAVV